MSNIKQIAQMAGVSRSTVSRVLNHHPHVHEDTRRKVQQVIDKLDYIQNSNAVQLKKGRTNTIGVVSPSISHYFMQIVQGIAEAGTTCHYQTLLYQTNEKADQELQALEMLRQKRLDGLIILRCGLDWEKVATYTKYGPIMTCEPLQHPKIQSIYMNHYEGFQLGLEHLIEKGYNRIACTIGRAESRNSLERKKAFEDILQTHNLPVHPEWILDETFTVNDGRTALQKLLNGNHMPDAVIHASDYVAAGMAAEARAQGISIPDELGLVGFESDQSDVAGLMELTHVRNPLKQMGAEAFHRMYAALTETPYTAVDLSFSLTERQSTARGVKQVQL
ncbi:LacI family transcriptional regulator [Terribacillus saccharophilus]|uniref:LacI family transcriptional regulator n=1 Tax=Terribacillus saccharophilus TaxID=361277 RepID=A0A075LMV7_9BACI|nr:LacI family DNA-binding transcriptional regulator [Terribacillus goriensis]AIF67297.1 LacI family transcriptional regulator [Terribacillus goriensis]